MKKGLMTKRVLYNENKAKEGLVNGSWALFQIYITMLLKIKV